MAQGEAAGGSGNAVWVTHLTGIKGRWDPPANLFGDLKGRFDDN